jgi:cell division protein FtsA
MNEESRYAVGIDIGTTTVRCVVASLSDEGNPTIVGIGSAPNNGMRKGVISNLSGPAKAIDDALGEAERVSGYQVNNATISVNGSHIISTKTDGMIALGSADHEISSDDLMRIEDVATLGKVPANREILDFVPHSYRLDGQDGIRDPLGMSGTRLEVKANVISALTPYVNNLHKTAEMANVRPDQTIASVVASAKAVLDEGQMESGVAVIDLGASTTGISIFEEGDLQFVRVLPVGSSNITNDLAIGLKTVPEVAEIVKLQHGVAIAREDSRNVMVKREKEHYSFDTIDIDEIIEARLEEIFEAVKKELKRAGRDKKLPSGIVLTGGGANLRKIAEFSRNYLELASQVGKIKEVGSAAGEVNKPELTTAIGLMLENSKISSFENRHISGEGGFFKKLFGKRK